MSKFKSEFKSEFNTYLNRTFFYQPNSLPKLSRQIKNNDVKNMPIKSDLNINFKKDNPIDLSRILLNTAKRERYSKRTTKVTNVIHWGQRKLLLTEIEFLTMYFEKKTNDKPTYVIYAGAAPGNHILYLSKLFPTVHFELYDPRNFSEKLTHTPKLDKINTYNQYFTDETAEKWISYNISNNDILFISDIRSSSLSMKFNEIENCVASDNKKQMEWYNIIKPVMSMFKFRLPYDSDKKTQYLEGDIYIQPYAPFSSTETRLIVGENAKTTQYDNRIYEEQMYYFNNYTREMPHKLYDMYDIDKEYGIRNDFDGTSEIFILKRYLTYMNSIELKDSPTRKIYDMFNEISKEISNHRTLRTDQPANSFNKKIMIEIYNAGYLPKGIKLNQNTYNIYIAPKYYYFKSLGFKLK